MLFETVREAQKGSEEAKLELVERFQPTIRANAWKLNREDGKNEKRSLPRTVGTPLGRTAIFLPFLRVALS